MMEPLALRLLKTRRIRMHQVLLVELMVVGLVEVSKIYQPLQNRLSPKSQILQKLISERIFLLPKPKRSSYAKRKAFTKTPILRHFDLECHIRIETDVSGYVIGGVLSQITSDQLSSDHATHKDPNSSKSKIGQWHPVAFFSRKIIPAETRYETHNQELLAIVEAFKTWRHY